jgi:hypothetical protein
MHLFPLTAERCCVLATVNAIEIIAGEKIVRLHRSGMCCTLRAIELDFGTFVEIAAVVQALALSIRTR